MLRFSRSFSVLTCQMCMRHYLPISSLEGSIIVRHLGLYFSTTSPFHYLPKLVIIHKENSDTVNLRKDRIHDVLKLKVFIVSFILFLASK